MGKPSAGGSMKPEALSGVAIAVSVAVALVQFIQWRRTDTLNRRIVEIEESRDLRERTPTIVGEHVENYDGGRSQVVLTNRGDVDIEDATIVVTALPPRVVGLIEGEVRVGRLAAGHKKALDLDENSHGEGGDLILQWDGSVLGHRVSGHVVVDVPALYPPMPDLFGGGR